jgi:flagellar biosynthesis chaperone FliJ
MSDNISVNTASDEVKNLRNKVKKLRDEITKLDKEILAWESTVEITLRWQPERSRSPILRWQSEKEENRDLADYSDTDYSLRA